MRWELHKGTDPWKILEIAVGMTVWGIFWKSQWGWLYGEKGFQQRKKACAKSQKGDVWDSKNASTRILNYGMVKWWAQSQSGFKTHVREFALHLSTGGTCPQMLTERAVQSNTFRDHGYRRWTGRIPGCHSSSVPSRYDPSSGGRGSNHSLVSSWGPHQEPPGTTDSMMQRLSEWISWLPSQCWPQQRTSQEMEAPQGSKIERTETGSPDRTHRWEASRALWPTLKVQGASNHGYCSTDKFVQRNNVWLLHKCRVWPWTLSFPNRHSANHCRGCCHGYSWLGIHCDNEGLLAAQALLLGESFFHVKTTPTHLVTSLQENPLSYENSIQRYVLLVFCDCIAWWDPFDKTYFFIWGPALPYVFLLCIRFTVYFSLSFKLK